MIEDEDDELSDVPSPKLCTLEEVEREYITAVYNRLGDKVLTAKVLGVCLKTLYNKLNKYELR